MAMTGDHLREERKSIEKEAFYTSRHFISHEAMTGGRLREERNPRKQNKKHSTALRQFMI